MSYEDNVRKYEEIIVDFQKEMETSRGLHKRDLAKCIKHLKKELAEYRMNYKKYFNEGTEKG